MRILLDECLPKDLARDLSGHAVTTVPQAGWGSISNGRLLKLIAGSAQFDVFITLDKNLPHQNKTAGLPFSVVVLRAKSNRLEHVLPFAAEILSRLASFKPGHVYVIASPV